MQQLQTTWATGLVKQSAERAEINPVPAGGARFRHTESGIVPVNLLLNSSMTTMSAIFPSSFGMVPVIKFSCNCKKFKFERFLTDAERVPESIFELRSMTCNDVRP